MTRQRPAFVCGPPDNGCYVMGRKAGDLHRWEANTHVSTAHIGYGQGPVCLVCGLPWGTWHADVTVELRAGVEAAKVDRVSELIAVGVLHEHRADRPYAYVPAYEVVCPLRSCGARVLAPCTTRGVRRYAPHARRTTTAAANGFDGSDL